MQTVKGDPVPVDIIDRALANLTPDINVIVNDRASIEIKKGVVHFKKLHIDCGFKLRTPHEIAMACLDAFYEHCKAIIDAGAGADSGNMVKDKK